MCVLQVYDGGFEPDDFVWYNCGSAERYGPLYTKTNVLFVQFFSDDQPEEMYGGVYILYRNMNCEHFTKARLCDIQRFLHL